MGPILEYIMITEIMKNKNKLKGSRFYSAGPLEMNSDKNALDWRLQVHNELSKLGIIHLDPTKEMFDDGVVESNDIRKNFRDEVYKGNWDEVVDYFSKVIYKDCRLLDVSDFVVFNWHDFKTPTFGTHTELWLAINQKKPVFVICENINEVPFWIMGLLKSRSYFYQSVESCIETIKKIDSGEIPMESRKWKLLREELR